MFTGVDRRLVDLLAYTTYWPRSHKCSPAKELKAFSGFVSNLNKSMMRCRLWVLCLLAHRSGLACNSRLRESQISKLSRASGLDEGQPNNRKLNGPCARRQIRINFVCMFVIGYLCWNICSFMSAIVVYHLSILRSIPLIGHFSRRESRTLVIARYLQVKIESHHRLASLSTNYR